MSSEKLIHGIDILNTVEFDFGKFSIMTYNNCTIIERISNKRHSSWTMYFEFIFVIEFFIGIKLTETKIEDWCGYDEIDERDKSYCICSHHIYIRNRILYKPKNIFFIVGLDCVKKHMPKLYKDISNERKKIKKEEKEKLKIEKETLARLQEIEKLEKQIEKETLARLQAKEKLEKQRKEERLKRVSTGLYSYIDNFKCHIFKNKIGVVTYKELIEDHKGLAKWLIDKNILKEKDQKIIDYIKNKLFL
jgi:hypothetical protein